MLESGLEAEAPGGLLWGASLHLGPHTGACQPCPLPLPNTNSSESERAPGENAKGSNFSCFEPYKINVARSCLACGVFKYRGTELKLSCCRFICVLSLYLCRSCGAETHTCCWWACSVQALPGTYRSDGSARSAMAANMQDWRSAVLPGTCSTAPYLPSKNPSSNSAQPFARAGLCNC